MATISELSSNSVFSSLTQSTTSGFGRLPIISDSGPKDKIQQRVQRQYVISYQHPQDLPNMHFVIFENEYNYVGGLGLNLKLEKAYRLPLPSPIQDAFSVQFDSNFSYLNVATNIAGSIFGRGGEAAVQGLSVAAAAAGFNINSMKTVTLKSPEFRQFTMSWKLAPKSQRESLEIQRMMYSLRKGMTPAAIAGGFVFEFPKIYTLFFYPNSEYLFKFKPCVLKNLSINYQGNNPVPVFYNETNAPESLTVQMTWLELEYWKKSDYKDSSETFDFPTNDPLDALNWYEYNKVVGSATAGLRSNMEQYGDPAAIAGAGAGQAGANTK